MQLSDTDILRAIKNGEIGFYGPNEKYPFEYEKQVQPASIDLRLDRTIVRFRDSVVAFDIKDKIDPEKHLVREFYDDGQPIIINPGEILFSQIYEQMWIGDRYSARVEGRSRVARLGLSVHCTGSFINPGFQGAMPLQIVNFNHFPITIYPYIGICQLVLFNLTNEPYVKYGSASQFLNPYYDEKIAGPSVLKAPSMEDEAQLSVSERRGRDLLKNYYAGLADGRRPMNEKELQKIVDGQNNININYGTQSLQQGSSGKQTSEISINNTSSISTKELLNELEQIKCSIRDKSPLTEEDEILLGDVLKAAKEIKSNNTTNAIEILKRCGSGLLSIVKSIGCSVTAAIIKDKMDL